MFKIKKIKQIHNKDYNHLEFIVENKDINRFFVPHQHDDSFTLSPFHKYHFSSNLHTMKKKARKGNV